LKRKNVFGGLPGQSKQTSHPDVATQADVFGTIAVYDGHIVNIGRVVTDSTFHHFVNVNLNGAGSNSLDPIKQKAFTASPTGQEHYEQFTAYFRNIAIWIAPKPLQTCMFDNLLWMARWDQQLRMLFSNRNIRDMHWSGLLIYGRATREVLEQYVSRCTTLDWVFAFDNPLARFRWWLDLNRPDPPPYEVPNVMVHPEELVNAVYGALAVELFRAAPNRNYDLRANLNEHMTEIKRKALSFISEQVKTVLSSRIRDTTLFMEELRQAGLSANKPMTTTKI
jgi:hypothetical protein